MIDKRTGRDALRRIDPGERGYPDVGGMVASVYPDFYAHPWEATWTLVSTSPKGEAVLDGACPNGLHLRRTITLAGGVVRDETVVENRSAEAVEAVLQSRADLDPGDIDHAIVGFSRQNGSLAQRQLIQPELPPTGSETYMDSEQPDGEWRLSNAEAGLV